MNPAPCIVLTPGVRVRHFSNRHGLDAVAFVTRPGERDQRIPPRPPILLQSLPPLPF